METIIHILAQLGKYLAIILFVGALYSEYAYKNKGCLPKLLRLIVICGSLLLFMVCRHYTGT